MAEALLRAKAGDRFEVRSAGIYAVDDGEAAAETKQALSAKGIDLKHTTRRLVEEQVRWADGILTMTEEQKRAVQQQFPDHIDKTHTLKEYTDDGTMSRENWQRLQSTYAELETKRALYRSGVEQKRLSGQEAKQLERAIAEMEKEIQTLEADRLSHNIHDPIGGSSDQYQNICDEIERLVEHFIAKERAAD